MSFDEFTGLPLAAMDLDNSTGLPGITDEVKRISLLSKTERQVELALKQAAYAEAVSYFNLTLSHQLRKPSSSPAPLPPNRQSS